MTRPASRAKHLDTLRENRSRRFESRLKPLLDVQGVATDGFRQRFFQDMALMQNRARGSLFELAGEALVTGHLRRMGHAGAELRRQVRFAVADGFRIADFYVPALRTSFEVKSGYVVWNKSVRLQAQKDAWLLGQAQAVARVVWLLFRGGSARALAGLQAAGIECFDLEFDTATPDPQPVTVIRI